MTSTPIAIGDIRRFALPDSPAMIVMALPGKPIPGIDATTEHYALRLIAEGYIDTEYLTSMQMIRCTVADPLPDLSALADAIHLDSSQAKLEGQAVVDRAVEILLEVIDTVREHLAIDKFEEDKHTFLIGEHLRLNRIACAVTGVDTPSEVSDD